jgi:hypothetical protein
MTPDVMEASGLSIRAIVLVSALAGRIQTRRVHMMHSTYRSIARLGAARTPLIAAVLGVLGCRDLPAPADPIARPLGASASLRSTIYEPDFDRYTASVVVTMTGGGIRQLPALPERRVEYGVERQLERGAWTTTYDFGNGVREAGTLRHAPIRKVVAGSDGVKYFDHNGDLVPLGSRLPELPNGADFPAMPEVRPRGGNAPVGDPRAWAANVVTSSEVGSQRRSQIERTFERAGAQGRTVRYRRQRDGFVTEIVLDTTRGTIEETRTRRGRYQASTRFEYQDIGSSRWLRVRSVQRHDDSEGARYPLIVEQVFVDQRFLRAEGR